MRRCNACHMEFTGDIDRCPLCRNELSGQAMPSPFPAQRVHIRPRRTALKMLAFGCGTLMLLLMFCGYLFGWPWPIVAAVAAVFAASYLFIRNAVAHAPDPLRLICRYFPVMVVVSLVWFLATRSMVVTTFVIPIVCLTAMAFDVVLMLVLRGRFVSQYAKYLLFDIVMGLLPLICIPMRLVSWDLLVLISALVALMLLLGLLVFTRRRLFDELRKLFSA